MPDVAERRSFLGSLYFLLTQIPGVGFVFQAFGEATAPARWAWLGLIFAFVVYPLLALSVGLLIVRIAPRPIHLIVQDFILDTVGVNGRVDKSNAVIDASIPMAFSQNGGEAYDERVSEGQLVRFDALVRRVPLTTTDPICINPRALSRSDVIGKLTVYSAQTTKQFTFNVYGALDDLMPVGTAIDNASWKEIQTDAPVPVSSYLFTIIFQPNPSLVQSHPFFHCNQIALTVNMNMFKPLLDEPQ